MEAFFGFTTLLAILTFLIPLMILGIYVEVAKIYKLLKEESKKKRRIYFKRVTK